MLLGDGDRLLVEQAGVGHLDGGPQAIIVGDPLLGAEDVEGFLDDRASGEVFPLTLFRLFLKVFRHHLWPVDNGYIEFAHSCSYAFKSQDACPDSGKRNSHALHLATWEPARFMT